MLNMSLNTKPALLHSEVETNGRKFIQIQLISWCDFSICLFGKLNPHVLEYGMLC